MATDKKISNLVLLHHEVFKTLEKFRKNWNKVENSNDFEKFYYQIRTRNYAGNLERGLIFLSNDDQSLYIHLNEKNSNVIISLDIQLNDDNQVTFSFNTYFYNKKQASYEDNKLLVDIKNKFESDDTLKECINKTNSNFEKINDALQAYAKIMLSKGNSLYDYCYQYDDFKNSIISQLKPEFVCIKCKSKVEPNISEADFNKLEFTPNNEKNPEKLTEQLVNLVLTTKNLILSGAPGTGKTYLAKNVAAKLIGYNSYSDFEKKSHKKNQIGFVQFHPSYDYTDFVEGLRPIVSDSSNQVAFDKKHGIFKQFCERALANQKQKYVFIIDEINRGEISKIFGELFYSVDPGYRGKKGCVRTQYANMDNEANEFDKELFGDNCPKDNYGHFFVPENVYIIGTMNDIDRSVESLDFAFRRRFPFKEITYASTIDSIIASCTSNSKEKDEKDFWKEARNRLFKLNEKIQDDKYKLGPNYCLGGSHLCNLKELREKQQDNDGAFSALWDYYLESVIREYFNGLPVDQVNEYIEELRNTYDLNNNEEEEQE